MRILMASEYYTPHWTGIVKAFAGLTKQLIDKGHSVTVVTTQYDKKLKTAEVIDGITIIRCPYVFKISRTYYSISILLQFISQLKNHECVIINSPNSNILPFSCLAKLFRKKLIIYHQGDLMLPRKTGNEVVHFFIEKVFDACTFLSFCMADTVSTYTLDYAMNSRVMKYFIPKFRAYIPAITLSTKKPSAPFIKKMDDLKKKYTLIGFAGRFVEEKGFDVLFQAIHQVIKKIPHARFIFAGQTHISYEPFFEKNVTLIKKNAGRIEFLGLLDDAELALFYSVIDVFVISSRSDCYPLTQIEAALSGCPIVATDIPGARMLVKETGLGQITSANDPIQLAHTIVSVVENKDRYKKNAHNVRRYFKTYETPPLN